MVVCRSSSSLRYLTCCTALDQPYYGLSRRHCLPPAAQLKYFAVLCCYPQDVGRLENIVGWYHSHPGYGCWLSGIDCSTQMLNQQFQVRHSWKHLAGFACTSQLATCTDSQAGTSWFSIAGNACVVATNCQRWSGNASSGSSCSGRVHCVGRVGRWC